MRGVSKSGMQATVLYLFNALPDIARGGNIPVAFSMFWRMLDFKIIHCPEQPTPKDDAGTPEDLIFRISELGIG